MQCLFIQTAADNIQRERHGQFKDNHEERDDSKKPSRRFRGKAIGGRFALLFYTLGIKRNKGRVKRAFRKHAAKHIGEFKSREERIRDDARTQKPRN